MAKSMEQIGKETKESFDKFFQQQVIPKKGKEEPLETKPNKSEAEKKAGAGTKQFFADVKTIGYVPSWEKNIVKPEAEPKPAEVAPSIINQEAKPGILKKGLKYAVDQLNPIKAFKEIREKWRENGAQFNEEFFEEKQVEMFFQDIPETERENYGYSQLLQQARNIDQVRGELFVKKNEKREQFAGIFSALGIKRDIVDDEDVRRLEANSGGQHKLLMEIGMKAFANDSQKLEKFLSRFDQQDVVLREANLETYFRAQNGKYGDKVVYGLDRIGKTFKELGLLRKMALTTIGTSGVVVGGAVLGFGALGVSTMMLGSRIGISALGGLSLGIGKKLKYEGKRRTKEDMEKVKYIEVILQSMGRNIDEGIQKMHNSISVEKIKATQSEQIFRDNRKAALWGVLSAVLGRTAGEYLAYEGITFRNVLGKVGLDHVLEKFRINFDELKHSVGNIFSGSPKIEAGKFPSVSGTVESIEPPGTQPGHAQYHSPSTDQPAESPFYVRDTEGKITGLTPEGEKHFQSLNTEPQPNAYYTRDAEGKIIGLTPQGEAHFKQFNAEPFEVPEASVKAGAAAQAAEIAKPKFEQIASGKFKSGGSIEKASGNVLRAIKANPAHFGLDPNSPNFSSQANAMREEMIEEFYKQRGFGSYKQFDAYVRSHIQKGDQFKIDYDSATGKFHMDYQGKAFGGQTFQSAGHEAAADAPSRGSRVAAGDALKPKAAPEHLPPKAGAVEHHPGKGGGKMKFSSEIEEMDRKAQAKWRDAVQAEQNLKAARPGFEAWDSQEYAKAHIRQVLATGRKLNVIFQGAGVSRWAEILNEPMGDWEKILGGKQIAQDVLQAGEIGDMNENLRKLNNLRPILEKYKASNSDKILDCLFRAMKDSKNVLMINRLVL